MGRDLGFGKCTGTPHVTLPRAATGMVIVALVVLSGSLATATNDQGVVPDQTGGGTGADGADETIYWGDAPPPVDEGRNQEQRAGAEAENCGEEEAEESPHNPHHADPWASMDWPEIADKSSDDTSTEDPSRFPFSMDGSIQIQTTAGVWANRLREQPLAVGRLAATGSIRGRHRWIRFVLTGYGEHDLAYLTQKDLHDPATLEVYQSLVQLRESYLAAHSSHLEVAVGRMITTWGDSEMITVLDIISPKDLREPGLAESAHWRLPVLSSRAGYYRGPHRVELVAVHEANFGLRPPPLGTFSPVRVPLVDAGFPQQMVDWLAAQGPMWMDSPRGVSLNSQQLFARWLFQGSKAEWGLVAASLLDPLGLLTLPEGSDWISAEPMTVTLEHPRYILMGASGLIPRGDWILRGELAYDLGRSVQYLQATPQGPELNDQQRHLLRWLMGVRHTGPGNAAFAVEVGHGLDVERPFGGGPSPLMPILDPTMAVRWEHSWLRERIRSEVMVLVTGEELKGGLFGRAEVTYTPLDALHLTLGLAVYQPGSGSSSIQGFTQHDRVYGRVSWTTALW